MRGDIAAEGGEIVAGGGLDCLRGADAPSYNEDAPGL